MLYSFTMFAVKQSWASAWTVAQGKWQASTTALIGSPYHSTNTALVEGDRYLLDIHATQIKMLSTNLTYGIAKGTDISWQIDLSTRQLLVALAADAKPRPIRWRYRSNVMDNRPYAQREKAIVAAK